MSQSLVAVGALVATIGIADSLNPSTVAPAMALAMQDRGARRAGAFTAGVAVVAMLGGAVLVAGPGQAIIAALPDPGAAVKHVAEEVFGIVLLALATAAWLARRRLAIALSGSSRRQTRGSGVAAACGLGAGIMAVELPTAFPYFAAIAAIVATGASLVVQLLLLAVFNIAFVLPLLAIVAVRAAAGDRAAPRLARLRAAAARYAGPVLAALLGAGGIVLIATGLRS